MSHLTLSSEEVAERGKELYEKHICSKVETPNNIGKLVSIDVETGKYEVGNDLILICQQLQLLHPGTAIWTERIGFNAVYVVGGTATVSLNDGTVCDVELHWYEAHGIGKREIKIKRFL